ncbi:MAG: hypothetical protein JXA53_07135 [Bacteroidales bacterium]|nr:hypothetical protein [Bacteroidales bacterium]
MADNRISLKIDDEKLVRINDALTVLETELGPNLITLTKEDRKSILRLGDKSQAFVDKAYEVAKLDTNIVSNFVDINEFEIDKATIKQFKPISLRLQKLTSDINDTEAIAGHEAYFAALQTYMLFKNAAKIGHPGAQAMVDELKVRFPKKRRKSIETEEAK